MKKRSVLNKREEKIMNLLWDGHDSLTTIEIEKLFSDEKLSRVTVFKAIQSLMNKGYISVAGLERSHTVYARRFEAAITREEYGAILLADIGLDISSFGNVAMAFLGSSNNSKKANKEMVKQLENVLEEMKNK